MHQALYRKWRPKRFEQVCGQEHITSILQYEVQTGTFSHAYLFCGSRGTGKTTCAKILAKAVNCLQPENGSPCGVCEACRSIDNGSATDVLEIDAASNNGVDNIRDIRDEVVYSPTALKYRVYIVDEVHMLSVSAFNALLKTLEEPPAHVMFILATTELHKLPETIISRCQRFDFRRIATSVLRDHLLEIAKAEDIVLEEEAAGMLARLSAGGMRDAISLLELCAGSRKPITGELVCATVGNNGREDMIRLAEAIADKKYDRILDEVAGVAASAKDIAVFWQDLISLYRDMLIVKTTRRADKYLDLTDSERNSLFQVTDRFTKEQLIYHSKMLSDALANMQKNGALKRTVAEITLIRMCDEALSTSPEAMLARLAKLENALAGGVTLACPPKEPEREDQTQAEPEKAVEATSSVTKKDEQTTGKSSVEGQRILKNLRAWVEVIERMRELDQSASAVLRQVRAYRDEAGKVILQCDTGFTEMMVSKVAADGKLSGVLSTVLGCEIRGNDLHIEVAKAGDDRKDLIIDELAEDDPAK